MRNVHMIEMRLDAAALHRFLRDQGMLRQREDEDLGYGLHAWLTAAFGKAAPKPWRLFAAPNRPLRVLGYGDRSHEELRALMDEFAVPSVAAVVQSLAGRRMPRFANGRVLGFEVQCCPVGRESQHGTEKDVFLLAAGANPQKKLVRSEVYGTWLSERIRHSGAAELVRVRVDGFRLVAQLRKGQSKGGRRAYQVLRRPAVLLRGQLVVSDADLFTDLLAHGIGRHRAFGYGMPLLSPPS